MALFGKKKKTEATPSTIDEQQKLVNELIGPTHPFKYRCPIGCQTIYRDAPSSGTLKCPLCGRTMQRA